MPLIAIALLALGCGGAIVLGFGVARSRGALLWRAAAAGFLCCCWGAVALAQLGWFSLVALGGLLAVGAAGVLAVRRGRAVANLRAARGLRGAPVGPWMGAALAAVLLAAAALGAHPGEHFAGGWDPGVYLAAGASVAHRGGLITRDPLLATLEPRERDALFPGARDGAMLLPGFYVHDARAGTVVPQFQPLYPALLGLAIAAAGARASLFVNLALALGSALLLFALALRLRGARHALAAAALLALDVVQVWNAGFATSEVAAQALLLAGFVLLEDFLADGDAAAGALAGLAFGLAPMATVTAVFVLPFALGAALAGGAPRRAAVPFGAALAVSLAHFALWSVVVAPQYLAGVAAYFPGLGRAVPALSAAVAALALAAWAAGDRLRPLAAAARRAAPALLAAALVLACCWFGALRPLLSPSEPARALLKLSWFVTPWVLLPAAAGGAALLARGGRRTETALLLAGFAMLFFFLHSPRMYPSYPFTLRRFTPLALPAIAYAAALLPAALLASRRRAARAGGGALLAAALVAPLWGNREFVRQRDWAGLAGFLEALDAGLPAGGLLLCQGRLPAYALEHFAGRTVLVLDRDGAARASAVEDVALRRLAAGEPVTLLTPAETPWSARLGFAPLFSRRLVTTRIDQELARRPVRGRRVELDYAALRVTQLGPGTAAERFPARVDVGENALGLGEGFPVVVALGGDPAARGRWTAAAAEMTVPWPPAGGAAVVLRAASGRGRRAPARVRLLLDGVPLGAALEAPAEFGELHFGAGPELPAPAPAGRRRLRIESSTWNPREAGLHGYPDGLGVLLDWVEIRPAGVAPEVRGR
jgi:hypothetical protein